MTALQKAQHPDIYTQLKLQLLDPGDSFAGVRKIYQPIDRYALSWDQLMQTPDTPTVARYRQTRETSMWFAIGVH